MKAITKDIQDTRWDVVLYLWFQGDLVYELTGVYPAQFFFWIHRDNGRVYVLQDLNADSLRSTQYKVMNMKSSE